MEAGQGAHHPADSHAAPTVQGPPGHLGKLVGQDVQILLKIRGIAQQHRHHLAAGKEADAAQVLGGQPVNGGREGRGGAVGALPAEKGGHHYGIARPVLYIPQQPHLSGIGLQLGLRLRLGIAVQHQGHHLGGAHLLLAPHRAGLAEQGVLGIDLLADGAQLLSQALDGQGLEHVADDVVLDGLLGVSEVIVAAQEGDVGGRAHLPHLPGQLDARDKGHPDVGEQQIRLVFFHQLEGVQPIAGTARQTEAQLLPWNHGADCLPQLVLVVRDNHRV